MAYLLGFEIVNLWHGGASDRVHNGAMAVCTFMFVTFNSTTYFFFKYHYKSKADEFFENCKSDIRGLMYLKFVTGIRNCTLGFAHFFLS